MLNLLKKSIASMQSQPTTNKYAENIKRWEDALHHYDNKNYLESLNSLISYIQPEFKDKIEEGKEYSIREGSSNLIIKVESNRLNLKVNFLQYDDKGTIPIALLRKLSQMNMEVFTLSVLRLGEGHIFVEYTDHLDLSHPHKIYNVLDEMLYFTDLYDDLFVKKFNLKLGDDDSTKNLRKNKDELWSLFQGYIEEAKKSIVEYRKKEFNSYMIDPYFTLYNKAIYCLQPEGYVKSLLLEAKSEINLRIDYQTKLRKIEKSFQQICEITKEEFDESMYDSIKFFTGKSFISSENLMGYFNPHSFTQLHQQTLYVINNTYGEGLVFDLLNRFHMNPNVEKILKDGLEAAAKTDRPKERSAAYTKLFNDLHAGLGSLDNTKVA